MPAERNNIVNMRGDPWPLPPNHGGGNNGDDLTVRVGRLESSVGALREDVAHIKATLPHLATRAWILGALVIGLVAIIASIFGAVGWMAQQYLTPILQHVHP